MRRLVLLALIVVLTAAALLPLGAENRRSVRAQDATPILVYISWDGMPGWIMEEMIAEGKLPNATRLAEMGVFVKRSTGNWPSLTAAGHAAVFNGSYGNVNGITANGIPAAPFENNPIGTRGPSGFSANSLITEPIWVTAAKQGRTSSLVSVTQSGPFTMYGDPSYVSNQGLPSFGDFAASLFIIDGYASRTIPPGLISGGGDEGLALADSDGSGWSNLPEGATFKSFTIGGDSAGTEGNVVLQGLLVASDGATFNHMALSADGDYATATILRVTPAQNDASQMSPPVRVSICPDDVCSTGWLHFRLTDLAADGSSFTLRHSYMSDLSLFITDQSPIEDFLTGGGAFTGNGPFLPSPFNTAPALPNVFGELAFLVNEWFFNNLVMEIERNEDDLYFSYSPYPDEWHHAFYGYMDENSPLYNETDAALAWSYAEAMYTNLDTHLGNVMEALDGTGRPWNIVLFTDHGFNSSWRIVYPNRILKEAGLLVLDAEGNIDPTQTRAYYGGENAGGIHINTARWKDGIVTEEQYEEVVQQVTDALTAATDPDTAEQMITTVYRAGEYEAEGLGGRHGADLYIGLTYGYYWNAGFSDGPVGEAAPAFTTGIHGVRPTGNDAMLGFGILGGANFVDGVVAAEARSIDFTPTAALAVGIEPAAHWTGTAFSDWVVAE